MLSLWIRTQKENGPEHITRAQCGLMDSNDCKCNRDQRRRASQVGTEELAITHFWSSIRQMAFAKVALIPQSQSEHTLQAMKLLTFLLDKKKVSLK
jgi:hypothetical protein